MAGTIPFRKVARRTVIESRRLCRQVFAPMNCSCSVASRIRVDFAGSASIAVDVNEAGLNGLAEAPPEAGARGGTGASIPARWQRRPPHDGNDSHQTQ